MSIAVPLGSVSMGRQRGSLAAVVPGSLALGALVFVGFAASGRPLALAAAAALGSCFIPLALVQTLVFTVGYIAVTATHIDDPMARLGVPSPWYALNAIAGFHLLLLWHRGRLRLNWSVVHLFALVFLATRMIGTLVANDGHSALRQTTQIGRDVIALVVASALLASIGGVRWSILGAVAAFAGLGWLAFVQEYVVGGIGDARGFNHVSSKADIGSSTVRHAGPLVDPNFWGRLLVAFFPLTLAALFAARSRWARVAAAWAMVGFLLAIYLSQSRGAFVSVFAATVVFLVLAGWRYSRWIVLTPVVVIVLLVNPFTGPRMETLFQIRDTNSSSTDLSLVARETAVKAGTEMFADNPIFGVGTGNFRSEVVTYQRELGGLTDEASDAGIAAHNSFLETAAETGVVGLVSLLLLFGAPVVLGLRALNRMRAMRTLIDCRDDMLWASALVAGVAGYAVASMFLHIVLFAPFLVLLAMIADLDRGYREIVEIQVASIPRRISSFTWRRGLRVALPLVVISAVLAMVVPMQRAQWTSNATFTLGVRPRSAEWIEAYEFDMVTRRSIIVSTIFEALVSREMSRDAFDKAGVALSDRDKYSITRRPTPQSAVLRVQVSGPDRATIQVIADHFVAEGIGRVERTNMPFILRVGADHSTVAWRSSELMSGRIALALGPLAFVLLGWIFVDRERSYRHERRFTAPQGTLWCT